VAAAAGIKERFGFGDEPEEPVPLDEVELRKPRLKVPSAFGELFRDEHYERVSHALGKAYRDVVRGFRGEFENPPDLVAFPRDESEIEVVLSWAEAEGAAVVPFGGGTSVVGGVEARSSRLICGGWIGCWRWMRSRWRLGFKPGRRVLGWRTSCASTG
jgi:alkyldihydroxyacetonephosphate synthase